MKKVWITGVSRGIGLATALKFLEEGYKVFGTSTSGESDIEHEDFLCFKLDLGNADSILEFTQTLTSKALELDVIINNAAILIEEWGIPDSAIYMDKLRKTFDVNFFGTIQITESLIPILNKESKIINISSNWGSFSDRAFDPYHPHYKMSKTALNIYTKLLGARLLDSGIIVAAFDPGWVKTDMGTMDAMTDPKDTANQIFELAISDIPSQQFWKDGQSRDW